MFTNPTTIEVPEEAPSNQDMIQIMEVVVVEFMVVLAQITMLMVKDLEVDGLTKLALITILLVQVVVYLKEVQALEEILFQE